MKRTTAIMLALCVICSVGLAPAPASAKAVKIGLSISDFETERWPVEQAIMTKLAHEQGAQLISQVANHDSKLQNDQIENLQLSVAGTHGFHMLQHKMEIYGICSECLKKRQDVTPLMSARQGERLVISKFTGGAGSRMRLMSMGLRVGDEIDVLTNLSQGQLVIAAENACFSG